MPATNESRLWLAVHLLYPHSAQAFEVYQAVVMQAEEAFSANDRSAVFTKLSQAFDKIPPISSQNSFYEFEFDQIDQWKLIYKNSQKSQLLIFIGVLIFELKLAEIAPIAKLSHDKAQFLFHQIFKKLTQNSPKLKLSDPVSFKKQNDVRVSYLFTYENLVDYCLGQLGEAENEKVKLGLELYPALMSAHDEYKKIITQIQNLKVLRVQSSIAASVAATKSKISQPPGNSALSSEKKDSSAYFNKTAAVFLGVVAVAVSIWQLLGVFSKFQNPQSRPVVIQEVETSRPVAINAASSEEALRAESVPPAPSSPEPTPEAAPPVTTAEVKAEPAAVQQPLKPEPELSPEGGLYRGTLAVKDIKASAPELTRLLTKLGATKAGEVELGWMKSEKLSYFHYIIEERNINEVEKLMRTIGSLSVKFEKHPRLVPGGSRRFIIEVAESR